MPFGYSGLRIPSWGFGGLLWAGATLCSYLPGMAGLVQWVGCLKPLVSASVVLEDSTVLHLGSLLFDPLGIPVRLLGGSNTFTSPLPQRQRFVIFLSLVFSRAEALALFNIAPSVFHSQIVRLCASSDSVV